MASPRNERYVRVATPQEFVDVAWVLARAFARDPVMNWFGHVKQMLPTEVDDYNALPPKAKSTLKKLYAFQHALVRATALSGGIVTVAVISGTPQLHEQTGDSVPKKEIIAGATLWLKPGQTLDFTLGTAIRSGLIKVPFVWGFTGVKRLTHEFSPEVERSLLKSFKAHDMDRLDSWHLLATAVDPQHEGKGLCSLMMREGFERTAPKPVHLEASTARSRAIYSHFLFEIDEEHVFGKGAVDSRGLPAKGSEATGYQDWIMTKGFSAAYRLDVSNNMRYRSCKKSTHLIRLSGSWRNLSRASFISTRHARNIHSNAEPQHCRQIMSAVSGTQALPVIMYTNIYEISGTKV